MSNVVDFDADDNAVDAVETQQAPPPPVVNPTEVAREVARILHNGQRMSQQPVQQRSAVESEIENLIAQGYSAEALQVIARIRAAERTDEARQIYTSQHQQALMNVQQKTWDMALEVFEQYAEVLPALEDAQQGVLQRFHAIFNGDPEFRPEIMKIEAGQKPSRKAIQTAMSKAVDVFCKKAGISKPAAPVSLSTSKPAQPATAGGASTSNLDHNQKKLYNALKGVLGESQALVRAKEMYSD